MQSIHLGEKNDSYDRDGVLGNIFINYKDGEKKDISLVGEPYISVDCGDRQGVYEVIQYDGKGDYSTGFKKLYKEIQG